MLEYNSDYSPHAIINQKYNFKLNDIVYFIFMIDPLMLICVDSATSAKPHRVGMFHSNMNESFVILVIVIFVIPER